MRLGLFAKRIIEPELMDHVPPEQARPTLSDLVRINRRFGGHSVIRKTLAQVAGDNAAFTLLDVGAASGDTAGLIRDLYPRASVTNLDQNFINLEAAPPPKVIADAFALPFSSETFDYVLSSLFLHHFSDEQVVALLRSFYRIARRAVLICDLERHAVPYYFLPLTRGLFGWKGMTVSDGRISIRAGFRLRELLELSRRAGIHNAEGEAHRPAFRLALVARKTPAFEQT